MVATINILDTELEVDYIFIKGEEGEWDYPGYPDTLEIDSIKVNDVDIWDFIDHDIVEDINDMIIEKYPLINSIFLYKCKKKKKKIASFSQAKALRSFC